MNAFLHKAPTGGKLNSAHMWGDPQKVSVLTCSRSCFSLFWNTQAAISPTEHFLQIKLLIVRVSKLALAVPGHPSHATAGPVSSSHSSALPEQRPPKPDALMSPCPSLTFTCPHPQWGAQCPLAALPLGVALPGGPPGGPGSDCKQN